MKTLDIAILLTLGFVIWILGTIYYASRGPAVLETTALRYWIAFALSPIVSGLLCIAILGWRQMPAAHWAPSSASHLRAHRGFVRFHEPIDQLA